MNHYTVHEIASKPGYWRYTRTNDGVTLATGYCARDPATGTLCEGHDTPEGAREHYKEYLLDNARYDGTFMPSYVGHDPANPCRECGAMTPKFAAVHGAEYFPLCDQHRDLEHLAKHLTVGDSWSSY